jgi:hypothetical protein
LFSNFLSTHSASATPLCALVVCLAALARFWTDWKAHSLLAELQNPGRQSAEDFYY